MVWEGRIRQAGLPSSGASRVGARWGRQDKGSAGCAHEVNLTYLKHWFDCLSGIDYKQGVRPRILAATCCNGLG